MSGNSYARDIHQDKKGDRGHDRFIPLGAAAAAFGLMGLYKQWSDAFEAIELANDISPAIVAGAMGSGTSYPFFGFFILAISCVFRYVNR